MLKQDFSFITSTNNDSFSKLKGLDLKELLNQIVAFSLTYRDKLNLPKKVFFGTEIEYEDLNLDLVTKFISQNCPRWDSKFDATVRSGGEVASKILSDNIICWDELQTTCQFLQSKNAYTKGNAGGHIHISPSILGVNKENWLQFIKTYIVYESVLFRFGYGEEIVGREKLNEYARPIADSLFKSLKELESSKDVIDILFALPTSNKYQAINFKNIDYYSVNEFKKNNTIEYRFPNGTVQEIIWQNNINALTKLMLAPSKKLIDIEYIDYKLKNERISSKNDFYRYNIVDLKNALEFVDMIFDNNLDKIYFLKQYIKDFADIYNNEEDIKTKILKK